MKTTLLPKILLLAVATASLAADPAPAPRAAPLCRILVVDVSGSMDGPRIAVAKQEMLQLAKQLPPSTRFPIILIPFNHQAERAVEYTDPAAFEAKVKSLRADGGTSIASGLREALAVIGKFKDTRTLSLFLFSDGEDNDQDGILAQERKLNGLFNDRHKRGLRQMIYLKRWENANSKLLEALIEGGKGGVLKVIDLATAKMAAVTLTPRFAVSRVRWAKDGSPALEVVVDAAIDVKGMPAAPLTPAEVRCVFPGATGDVVTKLEPGKPASLTVKLPLPKNLPGRKLDVGFAIREPVESIGKDGITIPMLPTDQVKLSIDVPTPRYKLDLEVAPAGPARWKDAIARSAVAPVAVTLKVTGDQSVPWDKPIDFLVKPGGATVLASGDRIRVKGPGAHAHEIEVQGAVNPVTGKMPYAFAIAPLADPDRMFEPAEVKHDDEVDAPAPVTTLLRATTRKVSTPRWVNLSQGVASFTAQVEVNVQGQLAPRTVFTLLASAPVRKMKVTPNTISTGRQTLTLQLHAVLPTAPARTAMSFRIQPPAPQGGVTVQVEGPLTMAVPGPAPARLELLIDGKHRPSYELTLADNQADEIELTVQPTLSGVSKKAAAGVRCSFDAKGSLGLGSDVRAVEVGKATVVRLRPTVEASPWFFRDALLTGQLKVAGDAATVAGTTQTIVVRVQSPFKRLAFYLVASLAAVGTLGLLTLLFVKLRQPGRPFRETSPGAKAA